jgi:hypothetical protein
MLRVVRFLVLACGALLVGTAASAQADHSAVARAPVLVALVESLPGPEPRFRIIRIAGEPVQHAILLPADASPGLLSSAVEALRLVWAHTPDQSADSPGASYRLRSGTTDSAARRGTLPWAERVIADLRAEPERNVPGVGRARAVRIWLVPLPRAAMGP